MPFVDRTKDLVEQSIAVAREAVANERIERALMYEDFLAGDQLRYSEKLTGAAGAKYEKMAKLVYPFADQIITEFSGTYESPPARYFDSEKPTRANGGIWKKSKHDAEVALWHERAEDDEADYNPTFLMLDKKTRMHGRVLVRCWPAFDLGKQRENYPRFDIFHPGQFDIIADALHPARPLSIILYLETKDAGSGDNVAQVWTDDTAVEIVNGKRGEELPNKLGALPFVSFSNQIDTQEFWGVGLGNKVCTQNAVFDLGWTHAFAMAVNQAHGQPVGKDLGDKFWKNPKFGWDYIIDEPDENSSFHFENANPNIEGFLKVLNGIRQETYFSCGLPTNRFRDNYQPASGIAYRLENATILKDRKQRASLLYPRERSLWRLAFRVAQAFKITSLPVPRSIGIDYAPPEIPIDTAESIAKRNADIALGLVSAVDEYRRMNPQVMGDEEALEELRRNAAINLEIQGGAPKPTLRDMVQRAKIAQPPPPTEGVVE